MSKYKFGDFAINCTEKKIPSPEDYSTYIGLEHMDTKCLKISRWGSDVPIIGEKLVMHKGDILLGKRNAYLRRAAIAPHDGIFSAHGMILRPKEEIVDYNFFALFIASDYFFDEAIRISVGSLSPTINWKDLKELEFNLPDIETQRKLAKTLWSINDTLDSYKEMLKQSDELVKAKFIEMFRFEDLPKKRLDDICEVFGDGDWIESKDQSPEGIWLVQTGNVGNGEFKPKADKKHYVSEETFKRLNCTEIFEGDILISRLPDPVGRACILPKLTERCITAVDCTIIRLKDFVDSKYFLTFASSPEYFKQLEITGSTRQRVSRKNLGKILVPIAEIEKQKEFKIFVENIDKSKLNIQECITKLETLYKKIINKYLTKEEN